MNFNDVDVYAPDGGGIDCVHECFDASGTNDSSLFNPDTPDGTDAYGQEFETGDGGTDQSALDTGIGISQGGIAVGNGVNENTDLSALQTEVDANFDYLKQLRSDPLSGTHEWDISGGEYANYNADDLGYDLVLSDLLGNDLQGVNGTGDVFTSLNIVYIDTNGSDLKFNNTNFILDGMQDQDFIFLLNEGANFLVTNSKLLTGPNMDLFSTLWFVGGNEKRTIDFSQSESNKMSFWNHSPEGTIQANNYRACGQWVASNIQDWNDFSVDRCAFGEETPKVPVPATLPLLLGGIGLFGFAMRRRRT